MSGNYQSRVFSFISKRTNQLKNTCVQGLQHLKVAVVWSGQILLYPLQLLAQSAKIIDPQLPAPTAPRSLPQPVSDISIEQALELVVVAGKPIEIASTSRYQGFRARGEIDKSQLVLSSGTAVTKLTDDSSRNLEHYDPATADWEVASYIPDRSQRVAVQKPIIRGLSSILTDRQLVLVTIDNEILDILTLSQQQEIRRRIGLDLAITWHQWRTGALPASHVLTQPVIAAETAAEQLAIAGKNDNPDRMGLRQKLQHWFQGFQSPAPSPSPDSVQALIDSVDQASAHASQQLLAPNYSFTPQPPQTSRWLDLPQLPPIIESSAPDRDHPIQAAIGKFQPDWIKQLWNYYRDYLSIPSDKDLQILDQSAEFQLIPFSSDRSLLAPNLNHQHESMLETARNQTGSRTNNTKKNPTSKLITGSSKISTRILEDVEYQPDWIETTSEPIGYNQSLIARFLAWLDRLFLSIENWLIKIWEVITNHPARN